MALIPNQFKLELAQAFFDIGPFKLSLHTSALTPDADAHNYHDDVGSEVTGTNYNAGGEDIGLPSAITKDNANDRVNVDWDDYIFINITVPEIRYAVIYKYTGDLSTSPVVAILDFGSNQAVVADNFLVQFNAEGALRVL